MRSIKTTTGVDIPLDGDLLAILETLFHEVTAKVLAGGSYEEMNREINHLVSQLSNDELRSYLVESLFLNQVKYENDRLERYMKKLPKT
jgi:phage gp29-like protein